MRRIACELRWRCYYAALLVFVGSTPALAQTTPADESTATPYLINVSRLESWSFFEPQPGGGDPTYTTVGNRATLGVRVTGRRFDLDGAFRYAQLLNLPEESIGPGALGNGALYFFSAEAPAAFQLYFKRMWLRAKNVLPGVSITAGRMDFSSGEESSFDDEALDDLQHRRIGARMIGNFEGSMFERSFDAVRVDVDRSRLALNASLLFPTQGGYEESANPTMSRVRLLAVSAAFKPRLVARQGIQLFAYQYRDRRDIDARPDNVIVGPSHADVSVATFGASQVGLFNLGSGKVETMLWAAGQTGDWYGQNHRAFSVSAEAGYRFAARGQPAVRIGHMHASGDRNPNDDRHGTFFPMIPSIDRYASSAAYTTMNLRDTFAELTFQPHSRMKLRFDAHGLALAEAADRWYYGSGATSQNSSFFGYASRSGRGATGLGTLGQVFVEFKFDSSWSMEGYFGVMRGGGVVSRTFAGRQLTLFQLQNTLTF